MLIGDNALVDARVKDTRRGDGQCVITDTDSTLGVDRSAIEEPADLRRRIAFGFTCVHQVILPLYYLSIVSRSIGDSWQLCKRTIKTQLLIS